jgi:hypothetical protein
MANRTTTVTKIIASATPKTLLAANDVRTMVTIYNNSDKILYIKYGDNASRDSFTLCIGHGDYLELPFPIYDGVISGFWDEDDLSGSAMITEIG